ncbi:amidohydrolase family protein [Clostridium sp. YIM B02505]|uniref:Amidohydrolase family protein n=1 Tax=Clostridium yunnanense TaxID=2800325 RepID=A0ABS1ETU4_9CLOT|nr:amidohydrolase family protein [Clostridium yunnanense]MBK1812787.1 amidohydrolase family protein [Clostridium yunnanense]
MSKIENQELKNGRFTAIVNARIFNGEKVIDESSVIIDGKNIIAIGGEVPKGAVIIDAKGSTLLPGLIDSHVHTSEDGLRHALKFGVTTELEMMGGYTKSGREIQLKGIDDIADVRSAGMGVTPPGGHPDELMGGDGIPDFVLKEMERMTEEEKAAFIAAHEQQHKHEEEAPSVTTIQGAIEHVREQVSQGADYIKILIEEGTVMNCPGLPVLSDEIYKAAVDEAHKFDKIVLAHVLTAESSKKAIDFGVNGLAHIFIDRPAWTPELIKIIADSGAFVTPCLVLNSSIIGNAASNLANDPRVSSRLSEEWIDTLNSSFNTFPQGSMKNNYHNVMDLHKAGVDILVGTDVSVPVPTLGGLAHGASVHHELQLLVEAGFTPIEALKAATSVPARRFSLTDRGHIVAGARADLLLVDGDPTTNISDTLSIKEIWIKGKRLKDI